VVGICLARDALLVTALLAVLKAGSAYLPLEPDLPPARLEYMARDADAAAVLTSSSLARFVPDGPPSIELDVDWPDDAPLVAVDPAVALSDPAWVLYTSGSTGVPKGVLGSHRGLVNRLWWGWRAEPFAPDEVCCAKTRLSFVDSVAELFGPLAAGVRLVVVDEARAADPRALAEVLVREGVTRLVAVPSLLSALVEVAGERLGASRLRQIISSGEPLTGEVVRRVRRALPGCRLLNLYGSTEVAADATWYAVDGEQAERVPIGRPLDNVWVRVLGPVRELVPVGAVGELFVGGAGVADGYVGAARDQEERFLADPFAPGERLYRTGDLGRWRADGVLEFLGRADRQVKIRGVRVEPGEVEQVLLAQPAVREAAVVARRGPEGTELAAFLVLAEPDAPLDGVRALLRARLPDQLVPAHLVPLAELPRLPNGKVDRAALAQRGDTGAVARAAKTEPRSETERIVAETFAEVLGVGGVGAFDDFFSLGGHSLLATRLASALGGRFAVELPLGDVFLHPAVADLAGVIEDLAGARARTDGVVEPAGPAVRPLARGDG
jgi:amino acid adenylation domain-containing protein